MLKTRFLAVTAVAAATALLSVSCSNSKKDTTVAQADTTPVEEVAPAAPAAPATTYTSDFFTNPENKATGTEAPGDTVPKYNVTDSGLRYIHVTKGTGASPKATDNVEVHYTGTLLDGTVFDSSVERGETITFPLGGVIKGWTEGLQLMQEGGTTVFYIPSELAYGEQGTPGGPIPPNAPLIFEVQLIKVNPNK